MQGRYQGQLGVPLSSIGQQQRIEQHRRERLEGWCVLEAQRYVGQAYRDLLGKANQMLARAADEVYLLVACIPTRVK